MSKIKGFIGETLVYGFGNVFSRLFAMFLIPLYAKYLGKVDYSNLVMLQSTFTILTFVLALNAGIFFYYYEYDNLRYRKIILTSWFYYQVFAAILIFLSLYFLSPWLFNLFVIQNGNEEIIRWSLVLVGFQLFPYIFNITNINYFRIERKPKKVIQIVLLEALLTLIFVVLSLSVFKYGLIGVLFSQIFARLIVSIVFINHARLYIKLKYFSKKLLKKIIAYSWPFVLSSMFTWIIVSIDKFIGVHALADKMELALLALAMQLVLPISVLTDMIRMAIGPYVMSIRKEEDAEKSYQQIFELSVFVGSVVVVVVILISPLLTYVLADITYIDVIYVIPLMAFAKILSLIGNQFSICFSLVKKNIYILFSIIIAGAIGVAVNIFFMNKYGFVVSGYSQILAYIGMTTFLYFLGRRKANLKLKLKNSLVIVGVVVAYLIGLYFINPLVENGEYIVFILLCMLVFAFITWIYFKQQKVNLIALFKTVVNKNIKRNRA
ncbi:MAG: oligosaccharide flippase family protein [Bacteroidetes bacterium]|nr:oligosaccharide flippase family protein [Bacteroidota bacterium]